MTIFILFSFFVLYLHNQVMLFPLSRDRFVMTTTCSHHKERGLSSLIWDSFPMTSSLSYKRNIPKFSNFRDVSYYKAFCRPLFLYRLVGEDHSARPGHLCGNEFHSFESIPIFEKSFPAACNHRVDQEYQLIEKILL